MDIHPPCILFVADSVPTFEQNETVSFQAGIRADDTDV